MLVEELEADEEPEHGAPECLGQPGRVMHWPRDERPIRPKAAVGDEEVPVWMPVGPRAVRLQAGHDTDREVARARQRPDGRREGTGVDALRLRNAASHRHNNSAKAGVTAFASPPSATSRSTSRAASLMVGKP